MENNSIIKRLSGCFLILTLAGFLAAGCASTKSSKNSARGKRYTKLQPASSDPNYEKQANLHNLLEKAYSQAGRPYVYGGNSPESGFDCSGFVRWVFNGEDLNLPRISRDMAKHGKAVSLENIRPGDLIFFSSARSRGINHVGIYTGDDKYIHSPRTGKRIQENSLSGKGRGSNIVVIKRVLENDELVAPAEETKQAWLASAVSINNKTPIYARKNTSNVRRSSTTTRTRTSNIKASSNKTHRVNKGDTLYVLAQKHGLTATELKKANNIKGNNIIKPGQKLVIPAKKTARR